MNFRRTLSYWIAVTLLASSSALGRTLEARLDRSEIALGETVELRLRLAEDPARAGRSAEEVPDLTPLIDDFDLLDLTQSFRTRITNGQREASIEWQLTMAPRHAGEIQVPELRIGSATSQPLSLEVRETGATPTTTHGSAVPQHGPALFLETEVDENTPYVQGKVLLTVRLHADSSVIKGAFSEPVADGAIIERVGDDHSYSDVVGGKEYTVIERRYAIFPQRSGELELPPVIFEGERSAPRAVRHRDPFDRFFDSAGFGRFFADSPFRAGMPGGIFDAPGQPVRVRSDAISLRVRPKPATASAEWWVPATQVELIEHWESDPPSFRVGEPVNRLVAIRATGISVSQLPELELPPAEGFKQYREPALEDTLTRGDEVVAVKALQTALIPTRPGELTLPEIELGWWDTKADAARTARLPARTVQVAAGDSLAANTVAPTPAGGTPNERGISPLPPEPGLEPVTGHWLAAGIAFGLLAATGFGWRAVRRRTTAQRSAAEPESAPDTREVPRLAAAERSLRRACRSADPSAAVDALCEIGRARWTETPPLSAGAFARRAGGERLAAAVDTLERVRYSREPEEWNGAELWQAYSRGRRSRAPAHAGRAGPLPSLYPTCHERVSQA